MTYIPNLIAHGEMGFGNESQTIPLTQNDWAVVTRGTSDLWSAGSITTDSISYVDDTLRIEKDGVYLILMQLSMDGANSSEIEMGVYKDNSLLCICTSKTSLNNNKIFNLVYIDIASLLSGEKILPVIRNTANSDDVDVISGKLALIKVKDD